jgi:hypothetical protein
MRVEPVPSLDRSVQFSITLATAGQGLSRRQVRSLCTYLGTYTYRYTAKDTSWKERERQQQTNSSEAGAVNYQCLFLNTIKYKY